MEISNLFANATVILHLFWAIVIFFGAFLALVGYLHQNSALEYFYLTTIALTIFTFIYFRSCILTDIERKFRGTEFQDGFVRHYGKIFISNEINEKYISYLIFFIIIIGLVSLMYWHYKVIKLYAKR